MLLCIVLHAKCIQHGTDDTGLIKNPIFKELLPSIDEIKLFQQKTFNSNVMLLNSCDVEKILKYCRGTNNFVSILCFFQKSKFFLTF